MTTTKPTGKTEKAKKAPLSEADLKLAHEVHALAHVIYGHLTMAHPWAAPMEPFAGFETATPEAWAAPGLPTSPTW